MDEREDRQGLLSGAAAAASEWLPVVQDPGPMPADEPAARWLPEGGSAQLAPSVNGVAAESIWLATPKDSAPLSPTSDTAVTERRAARLAPEPGSAIRATAAAPPAPTPIFPATAGRAPVRGRRFVPLAAAIALLAVCGTALAALSGRISGGAPSVPTVSAPLPVTVRQATRAPAHRRGGGRNHARARLGHRRHLAQASPAVGAAGSHGSTASLTQSNLPAASAPTQGISSKK